jgi:hypothetical protein
VTDREPDQELLARLRVADPASSLPSAEPGRVDRLLEEAMSDTLHDPRTRESRDTGTRGRSPLTWLVAAAAVVLIAGAGILGLAQRDHGSTPGAHESVTQLSFTPPSGRCVVPNVGVLQEQSLAFRGTLASVDGGTATFDVDHWYAGGPTDTAEITAKTASTRSPLAELVQAAHLKVGGDYLVAAGDGNVLGCGFTGPATGQLQRLYDRAFG